MWAPQFLRALGLEMKQIYDFSDSRHKQSCVHCARLLLKEETNRDHVPSKSLLLEPYPENLPVVDVCKFCNEDFSSDEEYLAAFLGCVLTGTTDPDLQTNERVKRILQRSKGLRARIEGSKTAQTNLFDKE